MTDEEFVRMKNLLGTVIEQQAVFAENQANAEGRIASNAEAIAALLTIAQIHDQEITKANENVSARFEEVASRFKEMAAKSAKSDERINVLVDIVERYISKN